jgi:polyisoprenoid-binding protein YceI
MNANSTATNYTIDPAHSSAQFSVRHMMISNVKGEFGKVSGTIAYDPNNLNASTIEAVIDVESINTREPQRDGHLKSPDFFDAAQFPNLTFRSTGIRKADDGLEVRGDLTIRGVTRQVVLHVEEPPYETKDPWGNLRIGASATTKLNRKEWGLEWNQVLETGGVMVGHDVKITLDVEAIRNPATA